ncbi:MAG: HAD family hydrolase [Ignavibacteriaceae bacterium]|nr:HAD family hydrolase [Ignavibacteriaceae bacterium]
MNNHYKHIIWDWNGTLFNDVELCLDVLNGLLLRNELNPITITKYREIFTFPVKDYYAKAGLDLEKYSFEILGKEWMDEYQNRRLEARLFHNAEKYLQKIFSSGVEQSILSAYKQDTLLELVNHFQLSKYFTYLNGLDHIYATSKVDLGKELMEKLNHEKGEVLLVGDTVHDFEVAREIGADCVLIASGHQSKSKLVECKVKVYENLDEMMNNFKFTNQSISII